jgi:hypothetical protein
LDDPYTYSPDRARADVLMSDKDTTEVKPLATREETGLECDGLSEIEKLRIGETITSVVGRAEISRVFKKIFLEDAFRDGEWVEYQGRPITNLELYARELLEHKSWQAKTAAFEIAFGKEPQVQKVEGETTVIFKVEHSDDWAEAPVDEEEATFEVVD